MSLFTHGHLRAKKRPSPGLSNTPTPGGNKALASTAADSVVAVSLGLSRRTFFTTADLLAITVTLGQASAHHRGARAPR